jgi:hypothetical protein
MASLRSARIAPLEVVAEDTETNHGIAWSVSAPSTTTGAIRVG